MRCEKHRVPLRYVLVGGKRVLRCPFSHKKHFEEAGAPSCAQCEKPVYAESLCYMHWYYR